jgi:endonuclease/exonuclease/phosphatase (EEP) superfamily protein YafD
VVASVHTANPFEPEDQAEDVDRLIAFVRSRTAPVIMGGDFNLTPFSWKLTKLTHLTGLRRAQTFEASWPANRLTPFVLLDHILVPRDVALVDVETGPSVGSDHLPVTAGLVFARGPKPTTAQALMVR